MTLCISCGLDLTLPGEPEADDVESLIVEIAATRATHDGFSTTALSKLGPTGWDSEMRNLARRMKSERLRAEREAAA